MSMSSVSVKSDFAWIKNIICLTFQGRREIYSKRFHCSSALSNNISN